MCAHRVFAAVYDRMSGPMEREILGERRQRLLGEVTGRVLDIGAGTGANLPHLRRAERIVAAEPDAAMRLKLNRRLDRAPVPVEVSAASAEDLPFDDSTFDAVVFTLVLCTVSDPVKALSQARRVLRPGGRIVVLEHVRGSGKLARWQDRLAPVWSYFGAGCRPNRDTRATIEGAGFTFDEVRESEPFPRWVLTRTMLEGTARP